MNDNTIKFLALIHTHPDLPVVCMVDCNVVGDDCGRWLASIGDCEVGEYALYNERYYDDRDEFMEAYYDYNEETLDERFGYNPKIVHPRPLKQYEKEDIEANNAAEGRINEYLKEVADKAFRRAIIVNIDTPDYYVPEVKEEKN